MSLEYLAFFLSVYSAIVATWLAILRIREVRYIINHRLIVLAWCNQPFDSLEIDVANDARRPVTIKSIEILYSSEPSDGQLVFKTREELPQKLEEGDSWALTIPRSKLLEALNENPIAQKDYHRLWVVLETLTGQRFREVVRIGPEIIPRPCLKTARDFIAADVFLGFEQQESKIYTELEKKRRKDTKALS